MAEVGDDGRPYMRMGEVTPSELENPLAPQVPPSN